MAAKTYQRIDTRTLSTPHRNDTNRIPHFFKGITLVESALRVRGESIRILTARQIPDETTDLIANR